MTGTIKTLLADKKFGFIAREGETKDVFFHEDSLSGVALADLKPGDMVNFDIVDGPKGPAAANVTRA